MYLFIHQTKNKRVFHDPVTYCLFIMTRTAVSIKETHNMFCHAKIGGCCFRSVCATFNLFPFSSEATESETFLERIHR